MDPREQGRSVSLTAENIGGIERTEVEFDPGVTILSGRNATYRTSLLQAVIAALGSNRASLKGDTDEGSVRMELGDELYTRELHRENGQVTFSGNPYLEDPEPADLFAFLLESNEARRTVALDGDLREIILEPVNIDAIQAEIAELKAEKRGIQNQIDDLEAQKSKLPGFEEKRTKLTNEIEDTRQELKEKREELEVKSTDTAEAKEEQSELDAKMVELQRKQSSLETAKFQLESQQDSLATLNDERRSLEDAKSELDVNDDVDLDAIQTEIQQLRERKQSLSTELNKLQNVIQFNEEMLGGASEDIAAALRDDPSTEDVTNQLLDSNTVICWTCGAEVQQDRIEGTLDRLRDLLQTKFSERNDIESQVEDLKQRRKDIESQRKEQSRVEGRLADIRDEITDREAQITDLQDTRDELTDEIGTIEAEIEELEQKDRSDVLEIHREVNQLEIGLERLEEDRDRTVENIETLESEVAQIDNLEGQRAAIHDELANLRTRVEQLENQAIAEFNEHMDTVLEILDYANIDRIWVERTEREAREGRKKVTKSVFDLHVVRSPEGNATYEDAFEHLSESEREVTGLVFALAGYLAHEVYEEVPFMLLDSLEAIDARRIAKLIDYLQEYADYLAVALLTEDAVALDDSYRRIEDI